MYTIKSLFDFKKTNAIPLEQVEPVENIVKDFQQVQCLLVQYKKKHIQH